MNRSDQSSVYRPLIVACLVPLLFALVCQAYFTVSAERGAMVRGLEAKAKSLTSMLVNVTGPSLVLDDLDGVKEGLSFVRHDPDLAFAAALDAQGKVLAFLGSEKQARVQSELKAVPAEAIRRWDDLILAAAPVSSGTAMRGTVILGMSTQVIESDVQGMILPAVCIALAGIAAAVALVSWLSNALFRRNRDLKLLMDNADQGFLRVTQQGNLLEEHSAVLETWFGPWRTGMPLWEYLSPASPHGAEWLQLMWENVAADILPIHVSLEQLPREFNTPEHNFEFIYKTLEGSRGFNIMLMISDVTAKRAQERSKVEQREQLAIFTATLRDRAGVEDFFAEGRRLVERIVARNEADRMVVRRDVHTLKGNCATFGLVGLASLCHTVEDHLEENGDILSDSDADMLDSAWHQAEALLKSMSTQETTGMIDIEPWEQQRLLQLIGDGASHEELARIVKGWSDKPLRRILDRFARQARDVARRLGKGDVNTSVAADGVRIPPEALASFWSAFGHAITNAVDHGLEGEDERVRAGKNRVGSVNLRAMEKDDHLIVELEDDGRGIDWDKLSRLAQEAGLPHRERSDLLAVIYRGGISTRDDVTEASGRGIGMSAVHAACVSTGGQLHVESEPARGTRFTFSWPTSALRRENA